MPETIPISPGLISTRASEASAESIRTGAGVRSARPREGRLRRSGAAISSEPYTGEKGGGGKGAAEELVGVAACESERSDWSDREREQDRKGFGLGPSSPVYTEKRNLFFLPQTESFSAGRCWASWMDQIFAGRPDPAVLLLDRVPWLN